MHRTAIVLFARSPEREAVAKRMRFAAPLFRSLVAAWLREAQQYEATPIVACAAADRDGLASIAPEIERGWIEQRGGSFGDRVACAADEAFARGFDAVIIAAIDAPPRDLGEAIAALTSGVPVVSPSRDGGINFIGLVRPEPELLKRLAPRRRDLVRMCVRQLHDVTIVGGTIDLDSDSALTLAKRDRAWRAILPQSPTEEPRNRGTERPQALAFPRPSRAPPSF